MNLRRLSHGTTHRRMAMVWLVCMLLGSLALISASPAQAATPQPSGNIVTARPAAVGPAAVTGRFVHKATTSNISGHWTTIDNSATNNNPNAIVLVTQNWNPGGSGGTYNNAPIGVWYTGSRWAIFNQNFAAMPVNAAFNVIVYSADSTTFVHKASSSNIWYNWSTIDHWATNNNPNAIVQATPNWNPGGVGGTYNSSHIGVWYTGSRWAIFNQDLANMAVNSAFNVKVSTAGSSNFVHKATTSNISYHQTTIDNSATNNNPNARIMVTPNWNPGGVGGTYNNASIGVWYNGSRWAIFNQNFAAMPVDAAFNITVF